MTLRAEIDAANAEFMALFNGGDIEGLARCYTEGAMFMAPNNEPFEGRPAIAALLTGLRGAGNRLALETVEVEGVGDTAWERGRFTVTAPDGSPADHGKYIVIWKREGGAWRLHRDIINTSRPG